MIARVARTVAPVAWRTALLLAATAAVVAELASGIELPGDVSPSPAGGQPELHRPSAPSAATYPAIAQHPLFDPSRMPWAPPPAAAPAAVAAQLAPPAGFALSGVVVSGGMRSAILKPDNATRTVVIGEGETLGGWTLRRIDASGVHFELAGQTFDIGFPAARTGVR